MKTRFALLLILGLAAAPSASGQTAMQKLFDGFSSKKTPAPAAVPRESDARLIEILVELAWLGDAITFPFYIEARMEGGRLQLRGNVPTRAVHEHALKLAQTNTTLPLADDIKENPQLVVRPTRMPPDQLDKVVRAALRESLPRVAGSLQVRSSADGQVAVIGNVDSFEQKLSVSQVLRRLHGCTVALNRTRVGYDPDGRLAQNLKQPTVVASAPAAANPFGNANAAGKAPGASAAGATGTVVNSSPVGTVVQPGDTIITPPTVVLAPKNEGPRLTAAQLQKRIQEVCPRLRKVEVTLLKTGEHEIRLYVHDNAEGDACFQQIWQNIPNLDSYHPKWAQFNDIPDMK